MRDEVLPEGLHISGLDEVVHPLERVSHLRPIEEISCCEEMD